ncbi:hypothetical protein [Aurantiacibacter sp. MUD61]|uniref:hypothetical protein n=1 Tax=Aurantiacibacter sp. MUD61 TaxID=3009083 RepID=UPI0022F0F7CF|nr:hypothetical protein [Aurantiacibacter sp. MUD61]
MAKPDIIFADVNTIWHRRLAEALAAETQVIGIAPFTSPTAKASEEKTGEGQLRVEQPFVPPGWASRTAFIGQRLLCRRILRLARDLENPVVLLTSPAYAPLAAMLDGKLPIVTYTADDYASYSGWGNARQREAAMQRRACLSAYVSDALRQRAIAEDNIPAARTVTSANATEKRFAEREDSELDMLKGRKAPVLGVLGGLSDRLDLALIERVIALEEVGTFLVAGPVVDDLTAAHPALRSEKVVITGRLPHEQMHLYAQAMDAALIPYAATQLNHFCSPMRLYDHLATGVPIFALPTCDQVTNYPADHISVGSADALLMTIAEEICHPRVLQTGNGIYWSDRAVELLAAIGKNCTMSLESAAK